MPASSANTTLRSVLLFLLTAATTTLLLGRVLPPIQRDAMRVKLGAFEQGKDEYDTLVIGSSMTYRGFEPEVFDRENESAGHPTRTFNLGLAGAQMAEAHVVLERVAALEPQALRYVLIEADRIARLRDHGDALTVKYIAAHDLTNTRLEWDFLADLAEDPLELWSARKRRIVALTYHTLGVGRCVPWVEGLLGQGVTRAQRDGWLGPRGDGFWLLEEDPGPGVALRRRQFLRLEEAHDRDLHRMSLKAPSLEAYPTALPFFERLRAQGRAMGVEVIFFSIRSGYLDGQAAALADAGELEGLLRFDDDQAYPEIYDASYTFDGLHFNREGARVFTRYVSRAFVEFVEGRGP